MTDLIERLQNITENDDHARGCQGREYACECGYDERKDALITEAAAALRTKSERIVELGAAAQLGAEAIDNIITSHEGQHEHAQLKAAFDALEAALSSAKPVSPPIRDALK